MNFFLVRIPIVAVLTLLAACVTAPRSREEVSYAPTLPNEAYAETAPADGAIYHASQNMELFPDPRAHRAGDILTIVLVENTQASKKASTKTSKTSSAELAAPTVAGVGATLNGKPFSFGLGGERGFAGDGESTQSNRLSGDITVTVAQRLANGNLVVRGEKLLTINQGQEVVRVSGIVRPQDITTDNTVPSTRVANANIAYTGRGSLADANEQGWLSRFFNSKWMPY
jgi:flagellar L-ring protein precursor FlgH